MFLHGKMRYTAAALSGAENRFGALHTIGALHTRRLEEI
jgi:hypothetical protein